MKRLKEILKILGFKQIIDIFAFPIIYLVSICYRPLTKNIWIIQENENEACDNGYIFFKYLRENRKDINAYYVINFKSKDFSKVQKLGNVIKYRSIKHWIYYLNASKIIVTQKYSNPSPALFYILHTKNIIKTPRIFLQHGIIKDNCEMFYYNKTNFRLFICGAKREYEYIKKTFKYPNKNVIYTGLARFDNLDYKDNKINKFILIAPTWRKWITNQSDFNLFMDNYYKILNNKDFIKYLKEREIQLQFVLHKNMKKYKINKWKTVNNIKINHNEEVDIQELLNKADMLITDYSSIFMDIAYRKRPIIYYQFDENEYRENHLPIGYFSYEKDGFGDICKKYEQVIEKAKYYIDNNFKIEDMYLERMNNFFERRDKNNCKRILEEVEKI